MDGDGQKGEEGKKRIINLKNKDACIATTPSLSHIKTSSYMDLIEKKKRRMIDHATIRN
jgi:hypothetical protein